MTNYATETVQNDQQEGQGVESKRGRVRRLFLDPLVRDGMRFPKRVDPEKQARWLAEIADDLAFLSDEHLRTLRVAMRTKGEGSGRCFWPERVTILGWAEHLCPRDLEDVPRVASWFGGRSGLEAAKENRLVAEFKFWERFKRPPTFDGDAQKVRNRADEWNARADRIRERQAAGRFVDERDETWLQWYDDTFARALALVKQNNKGHA